MLRFAFALLVLTQTTNAQCVNGVCPLKKTVQAVAQPVARTVQVVTQSQPVIRTTQAITQTVQARPVRTFVRRLLGR